MVFKLFSKSKENEIEMSVKKYKKFLHDDMGVGMSLSFKNETYYPEIEVFKNREIVFTLTGNDKKIVKYKENQVVHIEFTSSKNGLYLTTIKIIKKAVDEYNTYYTAHIISPIEKIQRRNSYRLPVHLDVSFSLLPNKLGTYTGIAKDISSGGMRMESNQFVAKSKKLQIFFEIDKKIYMANGVIIGTRYDDVFDKNIHHIKFEDLSRRDKKDLYDYILSEQKRRIRRGTGSI